MLSLGVQDLNSVVVELTDQQVLGDRLDAEANRAIKLAFVLAVTTSRGLKGEEVIGEHLKAVVFFIGDDDDLAVGVKGDSVWLFELSELSPLSSDLGTGWFALGVLDRIHFLIRL